MLVLLALVAINLALAVAPVAITMPMLAQKPWMLELSFVAKSAGPPIAALSLAIAAIILWRSWGNWVRRRRITAAAMTILVAAALAAGRINLVELMFAAAPGIELAAIDSFREIGDGDMVIGVTLEGVSRAYPVRYLAYHHLVNDRIGSTVLLPNY